MVADASVDTIIDCTLDRIARMTSATPSALEVQLDDLADKVERLALRHAELRRTNALLEQRVQQLDLERDALRTRLGQARTRVDRLLERLPPVADSNDEPR